MIKAIRKILNNFRIGILHATYHRCMRKAVMASEEKDLVKFKKYIYRAEDSWRKMVILIEKQKQWVESQHIQD